MSANIVVALVLSEMRKVLVSSTWQTCKLTKAVRILNKPLTEWSDFLAVLDTRHPLVVKFSYSVQLCCLQSIERNPDWSGSSQGDAQKLKLHLMRRDKLVINVAAVHRVAELVIITELLQFVASLAVYIRVFSQRFTLLQDCDEQILHKVVPLSTFYSKFQDYHYSLFDTAGRHYDVTNTARIRCSNIKV